ncbi:hypothetical protein LJR164_004511 [Phenylobacterium sp. LjRoot164]|uniref:hypothetical protein n=1 Tax=unclassified Phenylobacterium TaxID=2640670 RepID=UPI003ECDD1B9
MKLSWTVRADFLFIEWRECDGPAVSPPAGRGFGSRLFDSALPKSRGAVELVFDPEGVNCETKLALD